MKKVCVLTATRAEYGLLKRVILTLQEDTFIDVRVAVTGMHLSPEFGFTYQEIEKDGIKIDKKIEILLSSDTAQGVSKSMGLALISFGEYFASLKPDMLVILGDRFETLAVCMAALTERIPIAHIHGGETTEGAIDEAIRHAITKFSYLHFPSTDEYKNRIIQLGEAPERVFNVGALGVENIFKEELISKASLEQSLEYSLGAIYAVVTYHPVTLEESTAEVQLKELLDALNEFPQIKYIFTKANADSQGRIINQMLEQYVLNSDKGILVDSLGTQRYLSALKNCAMVIGNSSSGIIEAPLFQIPTINIGDRQKGRIQASSILNCKPKKTEITSAMEKALQMMENRELPSLDLKYGNGTTSVQIVKEIKKVLTQETINIKKEFYDLK